MDDQSYDSLTSLIKRNYIGDNDPSDEESITSHDSSFSSLPHLVTKPKCESYSKEESVEDDSILENQFDTSDDKYDKMPSLIPKNTSVTNEDILEHNRKGSNGTAIELMAVKENTEKHDLFTSLQAKLADLAMMNLTKDNK